MSRGCGYRLEDREAVAHLVVRESIVHCWAAVLKSELVSAGMMSRLHSDDV